jgi:AAA15 family ATPase/GTPase
MLIRFSVENFRSFKDKQEFSMVASNLKDSEDGVVQFPRMDVGLLRAAAIYGANASGKTNVLKALKGMADVVRDSYRDLKPEGPIPTSPFSLDEKSAKEPSFFEADILVGGIRYTYGFRLDSRLIREEWLYSFPRNRRTLLFRRNSAAPTPFEFGRALPGPNQTIKELTRRNSLFLSAAAQGNHEALLPIHRWFQDLTFVPSEKAFLEGFTARLCDNAERKATITRMLASADLGLTDIRVKEEAFDEKMTRVLAAVADEFEGQAKWNLPKSTVRVSLLHKGLGGRSTTLPLEEESEGTRAFFGVLSPVLQALDQGSLLCVDELDSSLHPLLAIQIIHLFNKTKGNPKNAQMIFSTQDTNLLGKEILRRDQVWFTEKDDEGRSHLYPLTDFKPRKNESLERGYLQGRYGAVPFIGAFVD